MVSWDAHTSHSIEPAPRPCNGSSALCRFVCCERSRRIEQAVKKYGSKALKEVAGAS